MKNSTRTWLFLVALSLMFVVGGYILNGRPGLLWGFALSFSLNTLVYFLGDTKINRLFESRNIDGQDPWGIIEITRDISAKARVPAPQIFVLKSDSYQAFASGRSARSSKIFITEPVVKSFTKEELESVISFLIATIRNQDVLSFGVASMMSGLILSATSFIDEKLSWLISDKLSKSIRETNGGILTWLFTPLASAIVHISVNPKNYYKTDKQAAQWIKDPQTYAKALWKLDSYSQTNPVNVPLDTAHMFIVNPLTKKDKNRYFHLQPRVERRIKRLIGYYPI